MWILRNQDKDRCSNHGNQSSCCGVYDILISYNFDGYGIIF